MTVAVIGGGISGLVTVLALRRAGIRATAYERAPVLRGAQAGNGLVIWHNAVRALESIGLGDALADVGAELASYQWRSATGSRLATWSITDGRRRTGVPCYTVSRPALHRMLSDEVGDDLVLGARFAEWEPKGTGVAVRFEDGRETSADVLVGADGIRSTVRRALHPHEPPPQYAGVTAWQGVVPAAGLDIAPGTFVNTFGRGLWFVYYRLPGGQVYWDGVVSEAVSRSCVATGRLGDLALPRLFAGWPDPIPALIAATSPGDVQPVDIYDRTPVTRWSTDRVTLVGDAAHPMTFNLGQGANQAIEGAVVLADCLAGEPDAGRALAQYDERRIERTRRVIRRSRANGVFSRLRNPLVCAGRDLFMWLAFDRVVYRKTYELTMDMSPCRNWSDR
ncbi:FAD-dependent monooxygenase [Cryptosporangium minutisporangium]|uniref:NAD(P)/FAD-dependent oxidoreductase n=1 Tax=Cryptosporangium minutisporangium TaxID=113569 RepID=A0ABP6SR13_9ACTN